MKKKMIKADIVLNFINDEELAKFSKKDIDKLILQVEQSLNNLPSQVIHMDSYTGYVGTRFHFKEEINPIRRDES